MNELAAIQSRISAMRFERARLRHQIEELDTRIDELHEQQDRLERAMVVAGLDPAASARQVGLGAVEASLRIESAGKPRDRDFKLSMTDVKTAG